MNNLPEYWVVEVDGTPLFKSTVIKYLNETYSCEWRGDGYKYYGYDGSLSHRGSDCHDTLERFKNNPMVITLQQFINCTTAKSKGPIIINVPKI